MSPLAPLPWNTPLSVSELNERIRSLLEEGFPYLQVRGAAISLRTPPSGHVYFTLSDGSATLRAVIWRNALRRIPQLPNEGDAVLATGRISVFAPRGEYQLIVEGLKTIGASDEREELLRLHARLAAEGVFDESRKRPLPLLPRAVGVVTSAGGAVIHDIRQVLERRFPGFHLILAHATVQGEGAPAQIARALSLLQEDGRAEVIICGRGGGAAEDLAAFNSEVVVRAIAACAVPVVSAVGHEVDLTLADLAADLRAPTPSAAAELVMPERLAMARRLTLAQERLQGAWRLQAERRARSLLHLRRRLRHPRQLLDQARLRGEDLSERLQRAAGQLLSRRRERLALAAARLAAWPQGRYLALQHARASHLTQRLHHTMARLLAARRERLLSPAARLHTLSPLVILERGYAIVRDDQGAIVRDAATLQAGDALRITLAKGGLEAQVSATREDS